MPREYVPRVALPIGLGFCIAGAGFALLGVFETAGRLTGLGVAMVGVLLTAPFSRARVAVVDWWWEATATGVMVALGGTALELAVAPLGGLLVGLGCVTAMVAAALGPRPGARGRERRPGARGREPR